MLATEGQSNYICAVCLRTRPARASASVDVSTGEAQATSFTGAAPVEHICNELGRFAPREALLSPERGAARAHAQVCSPTG